VSGPLNSDVRKNTDSAAERVKVLTVTPSADAWCPCRWSGIRATGLEHQAEPMRGLLRQRPQRRRSQATASCASRSHLPDQASEELVRSLQLLEVWGPA
jgi:hypothetical protein